MKLDRNINPNGIGKYALLLFRNLPTDPVGASQFNDALKVLVSLGVMDFGNTEDSEFFVIRLKDKYAAPALGAYVDAALADGQAEWAKEVDALAAKAATHPSKKQPD